MSYQSSKNKLQEIFQQRGEPLPTYTTSSVEHGGEQLFRATVRLACGRTFVGEPMKRKKDAEILAAACALPNAVAKPVEVGASACLFVDMENVPTVLDVLRAQVSLPQSKIIGFHSQNMNYSNADTLPDNYEIVQVPTMYRDGADVGLTMYLGACLMKEEYTNLAIVSKDHFANAAADCVRAWSTKHICVCRDAQSVIEWLKTV